MKILWVSEVFPDPNSGAGGTERLMVDELMSLGHDVETIWAHDLKRRIQHGNLHYAFELPGVYWRAVRKSIANGRFDVVTMNLGQSYLTVRRLRRQGFAGPIVLRSHGLDDHMAATLAPWRLKGAVKRRTLRTFLGHALQIILMRHMALAATSCDGYVVSNSLDAQWLTAKHGLSPDRIAVVPQAPSSSFQRPGRRVSGESRFHRVLYVANFNFSKGPEAVARAFHQLSKSPKCFQLTWVCGERDRPKVERVIEQAGGADVNIRGWMSQEELVSLFDEHGVFLYPSLFDGFGKVFLEAMARGLCVVGCRAGGMVDIIEDGKSGFLCQFDDSEQLAFCVNQIASNPSLATAMSNAAEIRAREYSWRRVGLELEAFFEKMIKSKVRK